MDRQDIVKFCLSFGDAMCDYPFRMDDNNCVARHISNKKWFALIYDKDNRLCINLKSEPMKADFFRSIYKDVVPGYHMNKTHWNTVYVGGDVPDDTIFTMIEESFHMTKKSNV